MKDAVTVALLIAAFAFLITMHVVIAFALARERPRWRGVVALIIPPLAPYWAWRDHMRKRAGLWVGGALVYLAMLALASRGP